MNNDKSILYARRKNLLTLVVTYSQEIQKFIGILFLICFSSPERVVQKRFASSGQRNVTENIWGDKTE